MTDKRKGALCAPFKFILFLASLIYALGLLARKIFYRFGIFKTNKAPLRVISVGNITLGGTGKTPFVITLAKILKNEIKKEVSVLIRGYGWDEQAMLKSNLADIPIFAGEDRVKSSHRAIKLYGSDTAILDDGFQYWELARDLDIVLIDSRNPFGSSRLFPRGILRERRDSMQRADVIVFTKVNKALFDIDVLKDGLKETVTEKAVFLEAVHTPRHLYDVKTKYIFDLSYINRKKVILFSSIGDPEYFEETVKDLGAEIVAHIIFPDHHNYSDKDIRHIMKVCDEKNFDLALTTEKDAVKLNRLRLSISDYPLLVLAVEMDIVSGKEELVARLHSLYSS